MTALSAAARAAVPEISAFLEDLADIDVASGGPGRPHLLEAALVLTTAARPQTEDEIVAFLATFASVLGIDGTAHAVRLAIHKALRDAGVFVLGPGVEFVADDAEALIRKIVSGVDLEVIVTRFDES